MFLDLSSLQGNHVEVLEVSLSMRRFTSVVYLDMNLIIVHDSMRCLHLLPVVMLGLFWVVFFVARERPLTAHKYARSLFHLLAQRSTLFSSKLFFVVDLDAQAEVWLATADGLIKIDVKVIIQLSHFYRRLITLHVARRDRTYN